MILKDIKIGVLVILSLFLFIVVYFRREEAFGGLPYEWPEEFYRYKVNVPITEKGYIVATKNPLEDVNTNVLPKSLTDTDILASFGAKGQHVPYSFVIYATDDIKKINLIVSDLKNDNGELITSNLIEVRIGMRQSQHRFSSKNPEDYVITTRFLPEFEPFDLPKGTFREMYILIQIPLQAIPGIYKGEILIKPDSNKSTKVLISLEVFPFTLQKPPDKKYGMYYHMNDSLRLYNGIKSQGYVKPEGRKRAKLEAEQMKNYEAADIFVLDSGIQYQKTSNEIKISYDEIETALAILRDSGVKNAQVVIRTRFEKLAKLLGHNIMEWQPGKTLDGTGYENLSKDEKFYSWAKKALIGLKKLQKSYPEFQIILTHYSDEIDYPKGRLPLYIELTKAARQVPEFKFYVTYHLTYRPERIKRLEKLRKEVDPYVDIRGHHGGLFEWWLIGGINPEEYKEELRKSKGVAWIYYNPNSPEKNAHFYRIVNGLNMWRNDIFTAHVPWTYFYYRRGHHNIYNDSLENDEKARMTGFSFPSWKDNITPIPTKIFEGWREGIYDTQYFYTLESQIKECKSKKPEVLNLIKEAEDWLLQIKNRYPSAEKLNPDEKRWSTSESLNIAPLTNSAMKRIDLKELDKIRYKAAQYIILLMKKCE